MSQSQSNTGRGQAKTAPPLRTAAQPEAAAQRTGLHACVRMRVSTCVSVQLRLNRANVRGHVRACEDEAVFLCAPHCPTHIFVDVPHGEEAMVGRQVHVVHLHRAKRAAPSKHLTTHRHLAGQAFLQQTNKHTPQNRVTGHEGEPSR
jgi:hypothetical protein